MNTLSKKIDRMTEALRAAGVRVTRQRLVLLGDPFVAVGTHGLILSVFILLLTVIILFIFLYTDRLLSRKEGIGLLGLYAAYVAWTVYAG